MERDIFTEDHEAYRETVREFLAREVIYRTPEFLRTHERQARENLRASLDRLRL